MPHHPDFNPPAFPCHNDDGKEYGLEKGMDLRDYFAAKAMASLLLRPEITAFDHAQVRAAFQIADAMLVIRREPLNV